MRNFQTILLAFLLAVTPMQLALAQSGFYGDMPGRVLPSTAPSAYKSGRLFNPDLNKDPDINRPVRCNTIPCAHYLVVNETNYPMDIKLFGKGKKSKVMGSVQPQSERLFYNVLPMGRVPVIFIPQGIVEEGVSERIRRQVFVPNYGAATVDKTFQTIITSMDLSLE